MRTVIDGKPLTLTEDAIWAAGLAAAKSRILPIAYAIHYADETVREVRAWFAENPGEVSKEVAEQ